MIIRLGMLSDIFLASLFAFFAGFVDAVVGGGGLVQVPALFVIFPHFSVPQIIGTNRFASIMGTSVAVWRYLRKVSINYQNVLPAIIGAASFSALGAQLSQYIREDILKPVILFLMIGIALYTYSQKSLGQDDTTKKLSQTKTAWLSFGIGALLGFYNGMVGPGTGSLLVFALVSFLGLNFLKASAKAKIINVVADLFSLLIFLYNGFVMFHLAIPMMFANMLGAYLGSQMAILKGNTFIRKFFLIVIFLLIMRFAYDIFNLYFTKNA
ncbi:MAG: TSUP family transporter [Thermonemataceae bacterium]|nr:TSUP family transporter [Thermonemataceae bacterium]